LKQNTAFADGDHVIGIAHTGDSKALSTLATLVADFSDLYSRRCGQDLKLHNDSSML